MHLAAINRDGTVSGFVGTVPDVGRSAIESTMQLYSRVGWGRPWIGYMAIEDDECVGTCAFTHAPEENVVEIAYHTFPKFECVGVATHMASSLISIAMEYDPQVAITAHTLPEKNASTRILEKTGFVFAGPRVHEIDGHIWVWRYQGVTSQPKLSSGPTPASGSSPTGREPRHGRRG
jgi:RimJ/RimL family protein N-acetyltransferase